MTGRAPLRTAAASTTTAILAVVVLAADQLSKQRVIDTLTPGERVPILGDFLVFQLVFNPGAAFSLGEGVTWIFTILLAAAAIAVAVIATRVRSWRWAIVLGLLLGGILGNLTDRLFRDPGFPVGHVVDFISTPWMMPAIYNVADMFIVTMMITVALFVLIGLRFDGTREGRSENRGADQDAEIEAPADDQASS